MRASDVLYRCTAQPVPRHGALAATACRQTWRSDPAACLCPTHRQPSRRYGDGRAGCLHTHTFSFAPFPQGWPCACTARTTSAARPVAGEARRRRAGAGLVLGLGQRPGQRPHARPCGAHRARGRGLAAGLYRTTAHLARVGGAAAGRTGPPGHAAHRWVRRLRARPGYRRHRVPPGGRTLVPGIHGESAGGPDRAARGGTGRFHAQHHPAPARCRLRGRRWAYQRAARGSGAERGLPAGADDHPQRQHRQRHAHRPGGRARRQRTGARAGAAGPGAHHHAGRCAPTGLWLPHARGRAPVGARLFGDQAAAQRRGPAARTVARVACTCFSVSARQRGRCVRGLLRQRAQLRPA